MSEHRSLALATTTEQLERLASRVVRSVDLVEACADQIDRFNADLNAIVTLDLDKAMAAAARADERRANGQTLGALDGVPFTVKDAIETAALRSTGGAQELSSHVPAADAPAVARLKAAGAILLGKTNVPTWSTDIQTNNSLFGLTRNPWNLDRTAGGSSGGSAVAVATGMASFELGADTGGSIRIPAHFCGVYGHRPSYGIVSQRGNLDHVGGGTTDADLSTFGPIARSAEDLALLMDVLVAPSPHESTAWAITLPAPRGRRLDEFRVGLWLDDPASAVADDIATVYSDLVDRIRTTGASVSSQRPNLTIEQVFPLFLGLIAAATLRSNPGGPTIDHRDWLELQKAREQTHSAWREYFLDHDVMLCPVMPMTAFPHDLRGTIVDRVVQINGTPRAHVETMMWTGIVGVSHLPSTVVPVGLTPEGMPVGVQVVGPYLEDRTCLEFARLLGDVVDQLGTPWCIA